MRAIILRYGGIKDVDGVFVTNDAADDAEWMIRLSDTEDRWDAIDDWEQDGEPEECPEGLTSEEQDAKNAGLSSLLTFLYPQLQEIEDVTDYTF
jgi:hypothetical protein